MLAPGSPVSVLTELPRWVVRFPSQCRAVWLMPEPLGGSYVILGDFGWLFGSRAEALAEAQRIGRALRLPVRGEAVS
jgi:hypothetical protein